jgi:molybdenum cofactor cytidylyltransferase
LLAAGESTRFGADKLLVLLPQGIPIAVRSARSMKAVLPRVVAVVRKGNQALWNLLAGEGLELVAAPELDVGIGSSLAAGVHAASDAAGWIVMLADMPFVSPSTIAAVMAAMQDGAALVAASFRNRRGHPVGFDRRYGPALQDLRGDAGARDILRNPEQALRLVDCDDPGVLIDVDVPADLSYVPVTG